MLPRAYLTVSRLDLPCCLAWPSGELLVGYSRVALLVGGKPRRIQVPPGNQTFTVVIYSILPGAHEVTITFTVEEGGDYRYGCRVRHGAYMKGLARMAGFILSSAAACWLGHLIVPLLRGPMLDLQLQAILATPHLNPALVPILYRLVLAITSELSGLTVGGAVFLWITRSIRAELWGSRVYDLEKLL
jgi:hypothetical protein